MYTCMYVDTCTRSYSDLSWAIAKVVSGDGTEDSPADCEEAGGQCGHTS